MKLCNDIYVLASLFEGASFEDMKELLSISKFNNENTQNDTVCIESSDTNVSCKHDSDISLFRSMLTTIQADMFSLIQENKSLREDYQNAVRKYSVTRTHGCSGSSFLLYIFTAVWEVWLVLIKGIYGCSSWWWFL